MNPANWLERTAAKKPDNTALIRGLEPVSDYQEFARYASRVAGLIQSEYDIGPGKRVAIFAGNSVEYLVAMYGIWWSGAAVVPINAKLHEKEAAWIIENAEAGLVLVSPESASGLKNALTTDVPLLVISPNTFADLPDPNPPLKPAVMAEDDLVWLFYTSGTTGRPKGVMITSANIQAMVSAYIDCVDAVHASDTAFYAAPLSHGAGIYNFQHVIKGARHAVPVSAGFDPAEIFEAGKALGNIHMFAAPTMVKRMVEHARKHGEIGEGIRTVVYGGGPMYLADIVEAVDVLGPRFCQIYGQGESPMCITALPRDEVADRHHPRWRERLASVGRAQTGMELRIADTGGKTVAAGEPGEILVRGRAVMKGYWKNPEASANALQDGWLWTGDMGKLDDDGYLTLIDRSKDVIISGGTNIYPREVEEAILTHPSVREVSVIGIPDDEWGEVVVAFVCLEPSSNADSDILDAHCLENIARFKRPKAYHFVDELPKNNYGKVLKTELRDRLK